MRIVIGIFFVFPLALSSIVFANNAPMREVRELRLAEALIVNDLIGVGGMLGARDVSSCRFGVGCSEVALALIAARSSRESLETLAALVRFKKDGAVAEDYDCYVLEKGKLIIPYLKKIDISNLSERCKSDVNARSHDLGHADGVGVYERTCSSEAGMKKAANDFIQAIRAGKKCDDGDF